MTSWQPTRRSSGPVAEPISLVDRARLATAQPHVLADPAQVGEHGVWTRASDVLPGLTIHDGDPVVAAWGPRIWHARARWDVDDPNTLWLSPIDGLSEPVVVDPDPILEQVRGVLEEFGRRPASRPGSLAALQGELDDTIRALVEQVNDAFEVVLGALEQRRRSAAWVLDAVARQETAVLDPQSPAYMVLARLAHRAHPTLGDGGWRD